MKLEEVIKQKLREAINLRPLTYDVGFQSKKNKNGDITKTTYLNIGGLTNVDKTTLTSPGFKAIPKKDGSSVFYPMTNDESFLNSVYFTKMYEYLKGTGNYIMPDIDIMKAEISQAKLDDVSPALIKDQNNRYEDLLERIMMSLGDPRTQELLQKISTIGFDINEELYGKVRSAGNAIRSYSVKPDATFVATRKNWKVLYNRILRPGAKPIILSVPISTGKDTSKAEAQLGVKFDDIKKNPHKADSFRINATTGIGGFIHNAFFDVSDTMVIPGSEDKWTGEAGLVDNLKGVLNQLAQEELSASSKGMEELNIKSDVSKNQIFFNRFIKYLDKNPGDIPSSELNKLKSMDPTSDEAVIAILRSYYSEISFSREHDPAKKDAKVYAAIAATLISEDLAEPSRLRIIKMHEKNIKNILTTRADFTSISLPVTNVSKILKPIKESSMNESVVTPEFIMSIFNIDQNSLQDEVLEEVEKDIEDCIEEKTQIKENFYKLFNKLK